jgi:DNA-binding transcriptional LysR family regulator
VELRHLRYFLAVTEEGGFVRAAERLHVAQPALSRQIRDVERDIGVPLIRRDRRPERLTPGGEAVWHAARSIVGEMTHAIERARGSSSGLAGKCTVCAGKLPTWNGMVARLVAVVRRDFPLVDLEITEGMGRSQWLALREGTCDLGIGMAPIPEFDDLERQPLGVQRFDAALLPTGHPLAGHPTIRLADLAADPIIAVVGVESDHHRMCAEVARRMGSPTSIHNADSAADVFARIAGEKGWTPFVRSLAMWAPPGTTVVPVEDLDASMTLHVISRRGEMAPVVRTVGDTLAALATESENHTGQEHVRRQPRSPDMASAMRNAAPGADLPLALELRHLRYFLTVVEERSIGRAARRLSITQPTLSRQVRDLERVVGVPLLERAARGAIPTAAGQTFAIDVRPVLDRVAGIALEARRATRGTIDHCLVATIPPTVVARLIGAFTRDLAVELPAVHVGFVEIPTPQQPEALVSGQVDVGICHSFTTVTPFLSRLQRVPMIDDPVCCVLVASDHPLASRDEIAMSELGELPFLFMPRSLYPAFYDRVMMSFAAYEFHPRIEQAYDGLQTTWSLAREGQGWCIGFRSNLRYPPAGLSAVPVRGLHLPWGIEMLSRRGEARRAVVRVMELLQRAAVRPEMR